MDVTQEPAPAAREVLRGWIERRGGYANFVETHVSVLAMTSDRVYKMKKPVRLPFVDLSTPALRRQVCLREVDLNSRLAPDVYLGVVDITDESGSIVDCAVEMLQMPDDRRLSELAVHGDARPCLRALAQQIAAFHDRAGTSSEIATAGSHEAIVALWRRELDEAAAFVGVVLDEESAADVDALAMRYLAGRRELFDLRVRDGRVRDGHGDLLADDVFCLDDGPRALDCLEFQDRLRWGDVLADVAFLAMDLERLGRPDLARDFLADYRSEAGDSWPASLEHHWIARRAHVRAKIACLRAVAGVPGARVEARRYFELCRNHLRRAQVILVLVGGSPGVGKTTLARALSERCGLTLVRSDVVRKELLGLDPLSHEPSDYQEGIYAPRITESVYREMLSRATRLLSLGESVVLDASWLSAGRRAGAAEVARARFADSVALECRAPTAVAEARISARIRARQDESDADVAIARAMSAHADPWPEAAKIDTGTDPEAAFEQAAAVIAAIR